MRYGACASIRHRRLAIVSLRNLINYVYESYVCGFINVIFLTIFVTHNIRVLEEFDDTIIKAKHSPVGWGVLSFCLEYVSL